MKRRGFFGFAAGAAVAGPGMAKEAANRLTSGLASGGFPMQTVGDSFGGWKGAATISDVAESFDRVANARTMLDQIGAITGNDRVRLRRAYAESYGTSLDFDLQAYQSIKPWAKQIMQVDRDIDRQINRRRSIFQRIIDGLEDHLEYPEWL
jgi:hypothetical protein